MKAIEVSDVSVYYDNVCAIRDVNLEISENEFLAIIGPNGAGKSTLLKVILGLIRPVNGEVKVFGNSIKKREKLIGYVPQAIEFDRNFPISVRDVILMGRLRSNFTFFHSYSKEDVQKAVDIMDRLELADLKERQIGQLSSGQLQRVLIARALAVEPKIMLLDEPTASVDLNSRNKIYSILNDLKKEMTIVAVTHDMAAISTYFDSVACLNKDLHYHGDKELEEAALKKVYGCPIELIAHGVPHRVFRAHEE
ncbi:ATP-binding cassette domain-containing protein [Iocasia frigidifontis]|uniref:ATP-binding cassette domain-containing protein n=1 Tax=Iocasia fonsfrigidae TaxID=2682810 RepID=A0A8A7KBV1_9FIRM|nr:metal ABC transporter ATP-binding protein [Iocasia fonsfrigidae]QTL98710.1 ATP-binding cassette domain-containing protein [Iocasia fonsfrigidae]